MIKVDWFGTFQSFFNCWNRFRHEDLDFNDSFGSKMLIKWQFQSNFKQNFALSNHISLSNSNSKYEVTQKGGLKERESPKKLNNVMNSKS